MVLKKLLFLTMVLLFPCLGHTDNWEVLNTNKAEYPVGFMLHEADIINIQENEFLMIMNSEKKQFAFIIIPGEKTVQQGIEEAKKMEQDRKNAAQSKYRTGEPIYLLYNYSDYIFFWRQE